jgi:hypothetical protein
MRITINADENDVLATSSIGGNVLFIPRGSIGSFLAEGLVNIKTVETFEGAKVTAPLPSDPAQELQVKVSEQAAIKPVPRRVVSIGEEGEISLESNGERVEFQWNEDRRFPFAVNASFMARVIPADAGADYDFMLRVEHSDLVLHARRAGIAKAKRPAKQPAKFKANYRTPNAKPHMVVLCSHGEDEDAESATLFVVGRSFDGDDEEFQGAKLSVPGVSIASGTKLWARIQHVGWEDGYSTFRVDLGPGMKLRATRVN